MGRVLCVLFCLGLTYAPPVEVVCVRGVASVVVADAAEDVEAQSVG